MNIGEVVKGIFLFLFEDATNTLIKPFLEFIEIVALSPETLMKMSFIDPLFAITQKIGAAILILITMWQGLKAMTVGMGFEVDEPQKIAVKTFISAFLIYYIKDILMKMIEICSSFVEFIMDTSGTAIDGTGLAEIVMRLFVSGVAGAVYMILGVVLVFKLFGLMFKMFKRLVMCAFLLICSPLAVATMISKPTEGFMQGFIKLFVGNIAIQIVQALCVVAIFASLEIGFQGSPMAGAQDFFSIMLTIALVTVLGQLEDILRDLSMSVGINRDMQGAFGRMQSMMYTASMLQGATRFVK